jgi:hypothetical protein
MPVHVVPSQWVPACNHQAVSHFRNSSTGRVLPDEATRKDKVKSWRQRKIHKQGENTK